MYLRIRMNLDPYFVELTLSSTTFRKFFSKNRVSRSTRVDCSFRALSTWVGKPPGTLTTLVNHEMGALTQFHIEKNVLQPMSSSFQLRVDFSSVTDAP